MLIFRDTTATITYVFATLLFASGLISLFAGLSSASNFKSCEGELEEKYGVDCQESPSTVIAIRIITLTLGVWAVYCSWLLSARARSRARFYTKQKVLNLSKENS